MKTFNNFNRTLPEKYCKGDEYYWLLNFDNNEYGLHETGKLINAEGNAIIPTTNLPNGTLKIWQLVEIETRLFAIMTTNTSFDIIYIYQLEFNDTATHLTYTYKNHISLIDVSGTDIDIKAYSLLETEYIKKIYIQVFNRQIKEFKIAETLIYEEINNTLESLSNPIIQTAKITSVSTNKGGNLRAGSYNYSCRYVGKNSVVSKWSDLSDSKLIVGVADNGYTSPNDLDEAGENYQTVDKTSDKNTVIIDTSEVLTLGFTGYIEILRVYRYDALKTPIYEIIALLPINSDSMTFDDTSNDIILKTLAQAEFLVPPNYPQFSFSEIFNDRKFIANIAEPRFIVDFDFRAYQKDSTGEVKFAQVEGNLNTDFVEGTWIINQNNPIEAKLEGGDGTYYLIPKNADIATDYSDTKILNFTGNNGASGPNIEITFTEDNTSVTNSESSSLNTLECKGLQPESVYRFAAVCIDEKGRESDPYIIGDLNTPAYDDLPGISISTWIANAVKLVASFEFSNLPEEIKKIKLVYVKRGVEDRLVVATGVQVPFNYERLIPVTDVSHTIATSTNCALFSPEHLLGGINLTNKSYILEPIKNLYVPGVTIANDLNITAKHATVTSSSVSSMPQVEDVHFTEIDITDEQDLQILKPFKFKIHNKDHTETQLSSTIAKCLVYNTTASGNDARTWIKVKQDIIPYGRNTYTSKINSDYYTFSETKDIVEGSGTATLIANGDHFTGMFTFQAYKLTRTSTDVDLVAKERVEYVSMPMSSAVNLAIHDSLFGQLEKLNDSKVYVSPEDNTQFNITINGTVTKLKLDLPSMYKHLNSYSISVLDRVHKMVELIADRSQYFPNMIRYSERKYPGEMQDNHLIFKSNNFAECDTSYGQITNLIKFKGRLMLFQEKAVSVLRVNEISQVVDDNGVSIALGQGDIIGSQGGKIADITAIGVGCGYNSNVIQSKNSLYWLDTRNRHIYRLTNPGAEPQAITLINGIQDIFDHTITLNTRLIGEYNGKTGEVYLSLLNIHSYSGDLNTGAVYDVDEVIADTVILELKYYDEFRNINLDLQPGDTIFPSHEYPNFYGKIHYVSDNHLQLIDCKNMPDPMPTSMSLIIHTKYLHSYTIVYSEIDSKFKRVLSLYPRQYINYKNFFMSIPFEDTNGTQSGGMPWLHIPTVRSSFYDVLYPSVAKFILPSRDQNKQWNGFYMAAHSLTEYTGEPLNYTSSVPSRQFTRDGYIYRTIDYVKAKIWGRFTDMIKIVPQLNELVTKSSQENTDFIETISEVENQPDKSFPSIGAESRDVDIDHFYNTKKKGEDWVIPVPKYRPEFMDKNDLYLSDGNPDKPWKESLISPWVDLTIVFNPKDNKEVIKINSINE